MGNARKHTPEQIVNILRQIEVAAVNGKTHPIASRTAAILASLTSTCKRHDLNLQLYLTQLLANLSATLHRDLSVWLPDQWKRR